MATFKSVKELTRGLQQGAKLLNDMFLKRKTVAVMLAAVEIQILLESL